MHKSLLIHNNNVVDKTSFDYCIAFESTGNIDSYIHDIIINKIKECDLNVIFIKDSLSSSYLELYGLIFSYHIRLTQKLEDIRFIPIVILSDVDSHTLNKLDPIARILFTKNIFIIKNTKEAIEEFQNKTNLKLLTEEEYKNDFLDLIEVKSPENSLSHSITNEWAIKRWASLLEVETEATKANKAKISSMLYFKYLSQKYKIGLDSQISNISKQDIDGKLLFIDDKGTEGWNDIVSKYVELHYSNLEFETLSSDFSNIENIKNKLKESIEKHIPNIVLLDLRLLESDINETTVNKISGVQILKYIKELNPSIQVIMFTASNDSSILDALFTIGIVGYVKKDSPTDKYITSKNGFKKLNSLIKKSIAKEYLMVIYQTQENIKKLDFLKLDDEKIKELKVAIKMVFEVLNSNMPNSFTYAMFSIFKCIEIITYLYIKEEKKSSYWIDTNDEILNNGYYLKRNEVTTTDIEHIERELKKNRKEKGETAVENKIRVILRDILRIEDPDLHCFIKHIVCIRNKEIHQDKIYKDKDFCKNIVTKEISKDVIVRWFEQLKTILTAIDIYIKK